MKNYLTSYTLNAACFFTKARFAALSVLLCCFWSGVMGQKSGPYETKHQDHELVNQNVYLEKYNDTTTTKISVKHKQQSKWHDIRQALNLSPSAKNLDTFDDTIKHFKDWSSKNIQATHTYIDTIYVHKGKHIQLTLPTYSIWGFSMESYQRWYNFKTDDTYEFKNRWQGYKTRDLLTPEFSGQYYKKAYRFANGYIGKPLGETLATMDFYYPTNEEFEEWFNKKENENDWHIVACDLSCYRDFAPKYQDNKPEKDDATSFWQAEHEPTIALRVLFYIVGVDSHDPKALAWKNGHGRLKDPAYQGANQNNYNEKRFLEEYNITYPSKRVSNHTLENVVLSKDGRSYAIPDTDENNTENNILLSLVENTAGIELAAEYIEGDWNSTERVIGFRKQGTQNRPWEVADGSKATILATKKVDGKVYNIARFNLTFKDDTRLLTQSQVAQLGTASAPADSWGKYSYRSPKFMKENLQLLTELNWEYDASIIGKLEEYGKDIYPFPMAWKYSSYAYYDGSLTRNSTSEKTQWGQYSIVNKYVGHGDSHPYENERNPATKEVPGSKDPSTYFMYIDVSDRPGSIARLPFKEKLCQGSELLVTAWVKSSGIVGDNDAAFLFTVMGVKEENGAETYTPIYRYSTGQVRTSCFLDEGEPGTGKGTNEWFQTYFSFINKDNTEYDSYVLQVDNNSASTTGGDIYLDEVKVFLMKPSADIAQLEATCLGNRTKMNMELDWERLISRCGVQPKDLGVIDFCFIDEVKYRETKKALLNQFGEERAEVMAIESAIVKVGSSTEKPDGGTYDFSYGTIYFEGTFSDNKLYDENTPGDNLANKNYKEITIGNKKVKKAFFYRHENMEKGKRLMVDFYSNLQPNRPYLMLINSKLVTDFSTPNAEDFKGFLEEPCAIYSRFYVTSHTLIKVGGEVLDPSATYCKGNVFNFTAHVRVPVYNEATHKMEYVPVEKGVYFDWFFGPIEQFDRKWADYGNVSIADALRNFREIYPESAVVNEQDTPPVTKGEANFTQSHFDLINFLANESKENKLMLKQENLNITIQDTLNLVIRPIKTTTPPTGIGQDKWDVICWEPIPVLLTASSEAPELRAGFNSIEYPSDYMNPNLRIGLKQIEKSQQIPIRLNLRNAQYVTKGVQYLGETADVIYRKLYLTDTTDPDYKPMVLKSDDPFEMSIGEVTKLHAQEYEQGSKYNDYAYIKFDLKQFNPKEGCEYVFSIYFEEKGSESQACLGTFPIRMKVVPEYLVWKGGSDFKKNWNDDSNWKRADIDDLKWPSGFNEYKTNKDTISNGYVPMLFSSVILPQDSKVELYQAGFGEGGSVWLDDLRPDYMELPTSGIQYDLIVYDRSKDSLTTEKYRVSICKNIHFSKGAQMKKAEYLIHHLGHVYADVPMPLKQWTLMSSPWKSEVAGDWYSDKNGKQHERKLFVPITFKSDSCNRYNPEVFQRSWDASAKMIEGSTNKTVSFQSLWSTAYNDAAVVHTPGLGYSMKAYFGKDGNNGGSPNDTITFRMPKFDTSYVVASNQQLKRDSVGRLMISALVDRKNPYGTTVFDYVTVELQPVLDLSNNNKFYIVGNPFMAHLNLAEFFKENASVLKQKYWTADNHGPQAGVAQDGKWTTVDGTSVAQIKPYGAFFVQLESNVPQPVKIKFTSAMQEFEKAPAAAAAFSVTAKGKAGRSSAAVAFVENATDGADAADAELLQDDQLYPKVPLVYTVAGDRAVSVNHCSGLRMIPLGVFADDGESVTLSFNGTACLGELELFDAETRESVKLDDDFTLEITGPSHGRFFLRTSGEATGVDEAVRKGDVNIYSVVRGQVVVAAEHGIRKVEVFNLGGERLAAETPADDVACRIDGLAKGVAIVRVTTTDGITVKKVNIK